MAAHGRIHGGSARGDAAHDPRRIHAHAKDVADQCSIIALLAWKRELLESDHGPALERMLRECLGWFDAFELNGTRCWKENGATIELARHYERPPDLRRRPPRLRAQRDASILTNAATFAAFVSEIHEGRSSILFMTQYREPMAQRILEASCDILRTYPEYPGRERWADRIFYRGEDGVARTLAQVCVTAASQVG